MSADGMNRFNVEEVCKALRTTKFQWRDYESILAAVREIPKPDGRLEHAPRKKGPQPRTKCVRGHPTVGPDADVRQRMRDGYLQTQCRRCERIRNDMNKGEEQSKRLRGGKAGGRVRTAKLTAKRMIPNVPRSGDHLACDPPNLCEECAALWEKTK